MATAPKTTTNRGDAPNPEVTKVSQEQQPGQLDTGNVDNTPGNTTAVVEANAEAAKIGPDSVDTYVDPLNRPTATPGPADKPIEGQAEVGKTYTVTNLRGPDLTDPGTNEVFAVGEGKEVVLSSYLHGQYKNGRVRLEA